MLQRKKEMVKKPGISCKTSPGSTACPEELIPGPTAAPRGKEQGEGGDLFRISVTRGIDFLPIPRSNAEGKGWMMATLSRFGMIFV